MSQERYEPGNYYHLYCRTSQTEIYQVETQTLKYQVHNLIIYVMTMSLQFSEYGLTFRLKTILIISHS